MNARSTVAALTTVACLTAAAISPAQAISPTLCGLLNIDGATLGKYWKDLWDAKAKNDKLIIHSDFETYPAYTAIGTPNDAVYGLAWYRAELIGVWPEQPRPEET